MPRSTAGEVHGSQFGCTTYCITIHEPYNMRTDQQGSLLGEAQHIVCQAPHTQVR